MKQVNVGILGATGAVGQEMIKILEERNFPVASLRPIASARSAGGKVLFRGQECTIVEASDDAFEGLDIVLGAAENDIAERFAPSIVKAGAVFVDNSSAFRLDPNVPLVIPEINPEDVKWHKGIIFLGGRSDYTPEEVALLGVPYVCCSYTNSYGTLDPAQYSSVSIADEQEAYRAVSELYRNGHRRIAALTADPNDNSISQLRYLGYRRALRDLNLTARPDDLICAKDFTIANAYDAMRERLRSPADFTAVFAISDDMAIGAMRAMRESGRSIPEDCSVIAIDGISVSEYIYPMLTTLCQPMTAMGETCVEILLDMIEGRGGNRHVTLPTALREGQSVRHIKA